MPTGIFLWMCHNCLSTSVIQPQRGFLEHFFMFLRKKSSSGWLKLVENDKIRTFPRNSEKRKARLIIHFVKTFGLPYSTKKNHFYNLRTSLTWSCIFSGRQNCALSFWGTGRTKVNLFVCHIFGKARPSKQTWISTIWTSLTVTKSPPPNICQGHYFKMSTEPPRAVSMSASSILSCLLNL